MMTVEEVETRIICLEKAVAVLIGLKPLFERMCESGEAQIKSMDSLLITIREIQKEIK